MLRDIRVTSHDTVTATGPKFDRAKALSIMCQVARGIHGSLSQRAGTQLTVTGNYTGSGGWKPCSVEGICREFAEFCEAVPYECSSESLKLRIECLTLHLKPSGWGSLFEKKNGKLVTTEGSPAAKLDVAPVMLVSSTAGPYTLSDDDADIVRYVFGGSAKRFCTAPELRNGKIGAIGTLRFPHDAFGDGEGEIRISLVSERTPASLH